MNRREFLKGTAWMGALALGAGCVTRETGGLPGPMQGFAAAPLRRVRVGVVGVGSRGFPAVGRLASIPGVEVVALCDLHPERVALAQQTLKDKGRPPAREYVGPEAYKEMCESDLDVVYNATDWKMHAPIALFAMEHGKHALVEVPAALNLDECWALVEAAERTRRHCMQLENCCYGEAELLCLNLVRQGFFGRIVHGEGAYIHDLRWLNYMDADIMMKDGVTGYNDFWRLRYNAEHCGNQYETHGLGPVCQCMNINRGDRFDYLVSLENDPRAFEHYGASLFPGDKWKSTLKIKMADTNSTLVRTANGNSILVQHDIASPRPYARLNLVSGMNGIFTGIKFADTAEEAFKMGDPCRFAWCEKKCGRIREYFDFKRTEEIRRDYRHPLWKSAGELAKKIGGHGGMDFIMDLRWAYCLQNGLPLDMDVYDLASWCCLGELTERSVTHRSASVDVPDFTRGGWCAAKPLGIVDVNLAKMGGGGV